MSCRVYQVINRKALLITCSINVRSLIDISDSIPQQGRSSPSQDPRPKSADSQELPRIRGQTVFLPGCGRLFQDQV